LGSTSLSFQRAHHACPRGYAASVGRTLREILKSCNPWMLLFGVERAPR
jgi:hypothetical protein